MQSNSLTPPSFALPNQNEVLLNRQGAIVPPGYRQIGSENAVNAVAADMFARALRNENFMPPIMSITNARMDTVKLTDILRKLEAENIGLDILPKGIRIPRIFNQYFMNNYYQPDYASSLGLLQFRIKDVIGPNGIVLDRNESMMFDILLGFIQKDKSLRGYFIKLFNEKKYILNLIYDPEQYNYAEKLGCPPSLSVELNQLDWENITNGDFLGPLLNSLKSLLNSESYESYLLSNCYFDIQEQATKLLSLFTRLQGNDHNRFTFSCLRSNLVIDAYPNQLSIQGILYDDRSIALNSYLSSSLVWFLQYLDVNPSDMQEFESIFPYPFSYLLFHFPKNGVAELFPAIQQCKTIGRCEVTEQSEQRIDSIAMLTSQISSSQFLNGIGQTTTTTTTIVDNGPTPTAYTTTAQLIYPTTTVITPLNMPQTTPMASHPLRISTEYKFLTMLKKLGAYPDINYNDFRSDSNPHRDILNCVDVEKFIHFGAGGWEQDLGALSFRIFKVKSPNCIIFQRNDEMAAFHLLIRYLIKNFDLTTQFQAENHQQHQNIEYLVGLFRKKEYRLIISFDDPTKSQAFEETALTFEEAIQKFQTIDRIPTSVTTTTSTRLSTIATSVSLATSTTNPFTVSSFASDAAQQSNRRGVKRKREEPVSWNRWHYCS